MNGMSGLDVFSGLASGTAEIGETLSQSSTNPFRPLLVRRTRAFVPMNIILCYREESLGAAWRAAFGDTPDVNIVAGDICRVPCDAIVSPPILLDSWMAD
jgi:hypothetical protein